MSDTQAPQIILSIKLDEGQTEKQLAQLVLDIEATKKAQVALNQERKAGKVADEEFAAQTVKLKAELKAQQVEQGALTKSLDLYRTATGDLNNTYKGTQAALSLAQQQYQRLQGSQDNSTEATRALGKTIDDYRNKLKATDATQGLFVRNVGNYGNEMAKAGVSTAQLTGGLKTATDTALKPFQATLDRGTGLFTKFKSGSDLVKTGLAALKPAGETGAGGFKAVAAGIALTGIGVFVLVLSAVISYFTQTNEGGKILKQGLAALGAVVTTVANTFTGAGKGLVEAFKNPKVALQDLLGFLKDQVVNRLAAFGVLIDGIRNRDFKKITDSVIQFNLGITNGTDKISAYASGIGNAAASAGELEAQFQKLKKRRAEQEIDEVKEKGRVEELIRLSKDRTLSAADRLNKLREAGRIEQELSGKTLDLVNQEEAALVKRNKAKGLSVTSDEIQEERDKRREYNATVAERNATLATIKARQSRFILEERAELLAAQKARADAAQQAKEDEIKSRQETVLGQLLAVEKGSAAELVLLQKQIDLKAELEAAGAKKKAQEQKNILAQAELDKQKLATDFNQRQIEEAKKHDAATVAESNREYAEAEKNLESYLNTKRAQVEQDFANKQIGEALYQQQLNAIEKAGLAAALVNAEDYGKDKAKILKGQADFEIKEAQRVAAQKKKVEDTKQQIQDASLQAAKGSTDAIIKLFGEESAAGQAAVALKKSLALVEIGINLERELSANALAAAKITTDVPAPAGPILAASYLAAADAASIVSAASAAATVLGFRQGGVLQGASHEQGGIPFTVAGRPGFEAEGGEVILTKGVFDSPLLRPMASMLNVLGGGVPLVPRAHMALGGVAASQSAALLGGVPVPTIDYNRLAAVLQNVNLSVSVRDTKAAAKRDAFTQAPR